jgi:short-subunit dehydrogenase
MSRTIHGSRILITGASQGIGRALAVLCARAGARVAVAARSADRLEELARELSAFDVLPAPADVTRDADRRRLLDAVADRFGGLDVLVNNAGVASFGHFTSSNEEILRQVMEVNFFAPAELMRLAVPLLTRGRQPAIVNVASMCGRRGVPAWSEYSASKFALCGLSEALRGEFARFDIDVLLVVPGLTQTDLRQHLLHNTGRLKIDRDRGLTPEQAAQAILDSLLRGRRETVVGSDARWILRVNRWLPWLVDRLMARRVRQLYQAEPASSEHALAQR